MKPPTRDPDNFRESFGQYADSGDGRLRNQLVEDHLGLAHQLARRFTNRGEPYDDLVQVASLALVKAVDRFDPERGVEFSTYATSTIIGELKRHFRYKGWAIRVRGGSRSFISGFVLSSKLLPKSWEGLLRSGRLPSALMCLKSRYSKLSKPVTTTGRRRSMHPTARRDRYPIGSDRSRPGTPARTIAFFWLCPWLIFPNENGRSSAFGSSTASPNLRSQLRWV